MTATSTGRRGYVGIDRRWLNNPDLTDSALRLMLWLDSHTDEYLRAMNVTRSAKELGWTRPRVTRAFTILADLGLVTTEQVPHPEGGRTRTLITLHHDEWSDAGYVSPSPIRMYHDDTEGMYHGDTSTTSTYSIEKSTLESASLVELCDLLADSIAARRAGNKRPTIGAVWISDMEKLRRIDGRTSDEIRAVISWLGSADEVATFWAPNIRSPKKLREKWDLMAEQYQRQRTKNKPGGHSIMDRIRSVT